MRASSALLVLLPVLAPGLYSCNGESPAAPDGGPDATLADGGDLGGTDATLADGGDLCESLDLLPVTEGYCVTFRKSLGDWGWPPAMAIRGDDYYDYVMGELPGECVVKRHRIDWDAGELTTPVVALSFELETSSGESEIFLLGQDLAVSPSGRVAVSYLNESTGRAYFHFIGEEGEPARLDGLSEWAQVVFAGKDLLLLDSTIGDQEGTIVYLVKEDKPPQALIRNLGDHPGRLAAGEEAFFVSFLAEEEQVERVLGFGLSIVKEAILEGTELSTMDADEILTVHAPERILGMEVLAGDLLVWQIDVASPTRDSKILRVPVDVNDDQVRPAGEPTLVMETPVDDIECFRMASHGEHLGLILVDVNPEKYSPADLVILEAR